MNFGQLQDRAMLLASFEAYSDVDPIPDWPALVNEAWRQFSFDGSLVTGTVSVTSAPNVCDYEVPGVKSVLDVSFAGVPLLKSDEQYERYLSQTWKTTPGTPLRWMETGLSALALVPVPSFAAEILVRGNVVGTDMGLPTDEPGVVNGFGTPIPSALHEAVALRAATLQMRAFAVERGAQRMADYEARYAAFVQQALTPGPVGSRQ